MLKKIVLGQIRHFLGAGGIGFSTWLISHGASPEDAEVILSGIVAFIAFLWSVYDKYKEEKNKQAEVNKALNTPTPSKKPKKGKLYENLNP